MSTQDFTPFQASALPSTRSEMRPVGTDIAFDFTRGEISSSVGDILLVRGTSTVAQWVLGSLLTERGSVPSMPATYGSRIKSRIGQMTDVAELTSIVSESASAHDRVDSVLNVEAERSPTNAEVSMISFTLLMDWGERITFRKVPIV